MLTANNTNLERVKMATRKKSMPASFMKGRAGRLSKAKRAEEARKKSKRHEKK
jgi:hypothetical protein